MKENKIRISVTREELFYLSHILNHFTDYMAYDDRPDHGMGILKRYRDMDNPTKSIVYRIAGRLLRGYRKPRKEPKI
jgi:hypothetical protein